MVKKATKVYNNAAPGEIGEPSQAAVDFLKESVIDPATKAVAEGNVTQATYQEYIELYSQYLNMPKPSAADVLDEGYYYNIRNSYFTNYYAMANGNTVAPRSMTNNTDAYQWQVKKNTDGTVLLINKSTNTAAYPASEAANANILLGQNYSWGLAEYTTDEGNSGIQIKNNSDENSWYTNPNAWANNVIFKPKTWGASVWTFIKLDISTGITDVTTDTSRTIYYDLQGRRVASPRHGVFITNKGKKVIR